MKTLDEVIEMFTKCTSPVFECRECSYCTGDEKKICNVSELNSDALHYLRNYRSDKLQWEADRKLWMDKQEQVDKARKKYIDKLKELEIGTLNDPLTWDELKQMEGKPVWVEALLYKKWAVIGYVGENHIRFEGVNLYAPESRTYMGVEDGWQAYRKERK